MISFKIEATTDRNTIGQFTLEAFASCRQSSNGISLQLDGEFPYKVTLTPPAGERLKNISYSVSTGLKNFHQVIVPDTGRAYPSQMQLVDFWAKKIGSRLNNIRMPLFLLTGSNMQTDFAFGIIGENFETDFLVHEPAKDRALVAWMKRFTVEISRGTEDYPIPETVAKANADGSITEHIYFKEGCAPEEENWLLTLRDFAEKMASLQGLAPRTTQDSLLPYWCSWTDWHSDNVTEEVILDNIREGLKIGIKNYIIDDGWFGPGLDSDFSIDLNIGDWEEDPQKIPDLKRLVDRMHEMDTNAVIWCAPHAVAPDAKCFPERKRYLIQNEPGEYMMTPNKFHSLCFQCPESREIMADICAGFITRYGVDGAKYDLFNCVNDTPCISGEHQHDTDSAIEGLTRTLALIDEKTRALRPDYIVELKQNYATPWLYGYGTVVRAGDTPYNPEGNFMRTAYINAYTPYSLNDYQTITNYDTPAAAAAIAVKMIAVGIPTYSIDLVALNDTHKDILGWYHQWYQHNLEDLKNYRIPLDPLFCSWRVRGRDGDIYFLVNGENRLSITEPRDCQIVNGTFCKELLLRFEKNVSMEAEVTSIGQTTGRQSTYRDTSLVSIPVDTGDIVKLTIV
ncbi:MAG: alpha-galactosidase [Phycisphaerae bacterium]|nr:alpha-galactosidase [Phycisphaerae bacterium]